MIRYFNNFEKMTISPLDDGMLDIWILSIPKIFSYYESLQRLLTDTEMKQALSFYRLQDQNRAILSRGLLRYFISQYLKKDNKTIQFRYGSYGKPFLVDNTLQFNLSHSHDLIAFAFMNSKPVGVDIEYKQPLADDLVSLLTSISSIHDINHFQHIPKLQKLDIFYYMWTIKEAYGKLLGKGLYPGLCDIDIISFAEKLVSAHEMPQFMQIGDFAVFNRFPLQGFVSAVACEDVPKAYHIHLLV